jgi:small subunit ribosomal protein S3Ae
MKDKWKAKNWYNVLAPASFDHVTIAETLADEPDKLINRVTEVSLQDMTNDFRKSHYKLYFKINRIEDTNAYSQYVGHTLTSDYLRRMVRRKRSKIDAVYDVITRDGAKVRIKPFTTTDHRIQNSQKKVIRETMKQTIIKQAKASTLSEFLKYIFDGKIGKDIYQSCKKLYPVKRVEIYKTQVLTQPRIQIDEIKKEAPIETPDEETPTEEKQDEDVSEEKEEEKETSVEEEESEEKPEEEEPEKKVEEEPVVEVSEDEEEPEVPEEIDTIEKEPQGEEPSELEEEAVEEEPDESEEEPEEKPKDKKPSESHKKTEPQIEEDESEEEELGSATDEDGEEEIDESSEDEDTSDEKKEKKE